MKNPLLWCALALSLASCSSLSKKPSPSPVAVSGKAGAPNVPLSREQAAARARQIAHTSYILWFGLDATHLDYQGRVVVNFQVRDKAREAGSELFLDFADGQIRSMTVNNAVQTEAQISGRYDGNRIRFKLSELQPGANRVEIAFAHAYSTTGNGLHRFQDPEDQEIYLYSNFEPYNARRMFPCFDQPDLKASFELTVEAPEGWTVVSNTPERDMTTVDGRKSWQFPPSPAISTYVFALHAGPYKAWKSDAEGLPIRLLARQSLAQYVDHEEWLSVTREGLDFYAVQFGYPYPFAKYDQLIVPDFNAGAMENVAAVTFSERYVHRGQVTEDRRRDRADTILHEMAHMWFGDLVTMRWWNGLWLNESFASYASAWALSEASRFKNGGRPWQSFFSEMKQWAYHEDQLVTTHPIEVSVPDTDHAFANFDGITYGKGASVLKQLSFYLGEDDFREGLQRYFQRFAFRNTTIADFMKMMTEASGRLLTDWQKQWLQSTGVNSLEVSYACAPDERTGQSQISSLTLRQGSPEGHADLRSHRARVALYNFPRGGRRTLRAGETAEVTYSKAESRVEDLEGKPCPDFVLANSGDYDYVKLVFDPKAIDIIRGNLSAFEDPLARQMIWHSLWEMVLDRKLAPQEYAAIVMANVRAEKDTLILRHVLGTLVSSSGGSATRFASDALRPELWNEAESFLRKGLERAPSGSDLQLTWYHAYLWAARSDESRQFLAALLSGKRKLPGFRIEQDRRWELVHALARAGYGDAPTLIEETLKKDPSDAGRKEAISAEAAIPEPSVKKKWADLLTRAVAQTELNNAQLREALRSFQAAGQEELTRPFADAYFEALPRLVASGEDEEYLGDFAESFFPALCDVKISEKAREFARRSDLPATVIKSLRESAQEEERCVRARELSASVKAPN